MAYGLLTMNMQYVELEALLNCLCWIWGRGRKDKEGKKFSAAPLIPAACLPGSSTTTLLFFLPLSHSYKQYFTYLLLPLLPVLTPWALLAPRPVGPSHGAAPAWAHLNLATENQSDSPVQTLQKGITSLDAVLFFFAALTALSIRICPYTKNAKASSAQML